ncbi:MAG: hypothetical protein R3A46_14145 [Thermomicrobiales bacterium]
MGVVLDIVGELAAFPVLQIDGEDLLADVAPISEAVDLVVEPAGDPDARRVVGVRLFLVRVVRIVVGDVGDAVPVGRPGDVRDALVMLRDLPRVTPESDRTNNPLLSTRFETKAMLSPSGDQRGSVLRVPSCVSCRLLEPSASESHS